MNDSVTPITQQEFDSYYQLRWKILRKPWHKPLGSEQDELEQQSVHRMLVNEQHQVLAVGRLHKVSQSEAQIRYMAVDENCQGQGLGKKIIQALEQVASMQGVRTIALNARESAVSFYETMGYKATGFSHVLYDEIRHIAMTRELTALNNNNVELARALQTIWHDTIPLSKAMNLNIAHYDQKSLVTNCDPAFNQNLHHTMFAGSIYTLATLTGWGWVYMQLEHAKLKGDIVLAHATIDYLEPIKGPAYAITSVDQVKGKLTALTTGKKTRFTLSVNVMAGDKIAAVFNGVYVVIADCNDIKTNE